jgi:hypothetical protein
MGFYLMFNLAEQKMFVNKIGVEFSEKNELNSADNLVIAVLVTYSKPLINVPAWSTLNDWLISSKNSHLTLNHILIYDNSPDPILRDFQDDDQLTYIHDPSNGGTRAALLKGSEIGLLKNADWLLMVDHDTLLPKNLLNIAADVSSQISAIPYAALAPKVLQNGALISPATISSAGIIRPIEEDATHNARVLITAIASGTFFNVASLNKIGKIPDIFWLDGLDHWIFCKFNQQNESVGILNCMLEHELSLNNIKNMPDWRIINFINSQRELLKVLPILASLTYPYRLFRFLLRVYWADKIKAKVILKRLFFK